MTIEFPKKAEYLEAADCPGDKPGVSVNVRSWARSMRLVDFAVDCAAICGNSTATNSGASKNTLLQERHWDRAHEIAYTLPKRELANAAKQLMAACNGGLAAGDSGSNVERMGMRSAMHPASTKKEKNYERKN